MEIKNAIVNSTKHNRGRIHRPFTALREVIAIIDLLEDLSTKGLPIHKITPRIRCTTFEDNMSCIKLATNHKTRPRTKHLFIRLHHFRYHIIRKIIHIEYINTKQQIVDILTKLLPQHNFQSSVLN